MYVGEASVLFDASVDIVGAGDTAATWKDAWGIKFVAVIANAKNVTV